MTARTLYDIQEDLNLDVRLDDALVLPCDVAVCENPAAWSLRCESCGRIILACTPDRNEVDQEVAAYALEARYFYCLGCRARFPIPLPWLPL